MYTSFHNVGGIGMMYGAAGKRIEKSTLSLSLQSLFPPTYPSRAPPPFRVRELPGFAGWRNEMCEAQKSIAQDQERERERGTKRKLCASICRRNSISFASVLQSSTHHLLHTITRETIRFTQLLTLPVACSNANWMSFNQTWEGSSLPPPARPQSLIAQQIKRLALVSSASTHPETGTTEAGGMSLRSLLKSACSVTCHSAPVSAVSLLSLTRHNGTSRLWMMTKLFIATRVTKSRRRCFAELKRPRWKGPRDMTIGTTQSVYRYTISTEPGQRHQQDGPPTNGILPNKKPTTDFSYFSEGGEETIHLLQALTQKEGRAPQSVCQHLVKNSVQHLSLPERKRKEKK